MQYKHRPRHAMGDEQAGDAEDQYLGDQEMPTRVKTSLTLESLRSAPMSASAISDMIAFISW